MPLGVLAATCLCLTAGALLARRHCRRKRRVKGLVQAAAPPPPPPSVILVDNPLQPPPPPPLPLLPSLWLVSDALSLGPGEVPRTWESPLQEGWKGVTEEGSGAVWFEHAASGRRQVEVPLLLPPPPARPPPIEVVKVEEEKKEAEVEPAITVEEEEGEEEQALPEQEPPPPPPPLPPPPPSPPQGEKEEVEALVEDSGPDLSFVARQVALVKQGQDRRKAHRDRYTAQKAPPPPPDYFQLLYSGSKGAQ